MSWRPRRQQLLQLLPDTFTLTHGPELDALYLSFDDGPHPEHTPALLDLLVRHNAHASFFLIGREAERYPALVRRIVEGGHSLGNHSYSHPQFQTLPLAQQLAEIDRTDALLAPFDGLARHRFRPPRGVVPPRLLLHFARHRRSLAYWSYDSLDYQKGSADRVLQRLRDAPPKPGDVVLMHDDSGCAGQVLAQILPEWRRAGLALLALPPERP